MKLRDPCHTSIVTHYLTHNPYRVQSSKSGDIHGRLRMAWAAQDASLPGHERKDMARPCEICRFAVRISKLLDCQGPVICGYPCGGSFFGIYAHGKRGTFQGGVSHHHHIEFEFLHLLFRSRNAYKPTAMFRHEIYGFRCHAVSSHDEITLIFPILVIDNYDHFTLLHFLHGLFYFVKICHINLVLHRV